jgi:hypothetical protein
VLIAHHLPELGAHLVAALARLHVHDLARRESLCEARGKVEPVRRTRKNTMAVLDIKFLSTIRSIYHAGT